MASKHIIQFYSISQLFKDRDRQLKRGEIAYNDGHVVEMEFNPALKPALLIGGVHASQRKDVKYKVEIRFNEETGFDKDLCNCTCAVGQDVCHHMAALLFYAHYNISSTDVECRWRAPKKKERRLCRVSKKCYHIRQPLGI